MAADYTVAGSDFHKGALVQDMRQAQETGQAAAEEAGASTVTAAVVHSSAVDSQD